MDVALASPLKALKSTWEVLDKSLGSYHFILQIVIDEAVLPEETRLLTINMSVNWNFFQLRCLNTLHQVVFPSQQQCKLTSWLEHLPSSIPIPKKGKPSSVPSFYRPIYLTSTLRKLFGRMFDGSASFWKAKISQIHLHRPNRQKMTLGSFPWPREGLRHGMERRNRN